MEDFLVAVFYNDHLFFSPFYHLDVFNDLYSEVHWSRLTFAGQGGKYYNKMIKAVGVYSFFVNSLSFWFNRYSKVSIPLKFCN